MSINIKIKIMTLTITLAPYSVYIKAILCVQCVCRLYILCRVRIFVIVQRKRVPRGAVVSLVTASSNQSSFRKALALPCKCKCEFECLTNVSFFHSLMWSCDEITSLSYIFFNEAMIFTDMKIIVAIYAVMTYNTVLFTKSGCWVTATTPLLQTVLNHNQKNG